MKFALVNGCRTEAQPTMKGTCVHCPSITIAKCGPVKIWHWAHKSKASCDPWWEGETGWHRGWKDHFPVDWQEKGHIDSATGERHVADIKTGSGLVIEFQHSVIESSETKSREDFYKEMVWVVNGARLKRDYPRFCKGFRSSLTSIQPGFFLFTSPKKYFSATWLISSKPVFFDFLGNAPINQAEKMRAPLWCLFPERVGWGYAVVARMSRDKFIEISSTAPHLLLAKDILFRIAQQSPLIEVVKSEKRTRTKAICEFRENKFVKFKF